MRAYYARCRPYRDFRDGATQTLFSEMFEVAQNVHTIEVTKYILPLVLTLAPPVNLDHYVAKTFNVLENILEDRDFTLVALRAWRSSPKASIYTSA